MTMQPIVHASRDFNDLNSHNFHDAKMWEIWWSAEKSWSVIGKNIKKTYEWNLKINVQKYV